MLSARSDRRADELRAWRRGGRLGGLGIVDERLGARLTLDRAVAIVLHDLDDLTAQAATGAAIDAADWLQLSADVQHLHRLVEDRRARRTEQPRVRAYPPTGG